MVGQLSSSLGLFAVIWLVFCALSSAVVTDAMLRSHDPAPSSREDGVAQKTASLQPGE